MTALHVSRSRHDIRTLASQPNHPVHDVRLVGAVRHGHKDVVAAGGRDARLHRVEHAAAEVVAVTADGRQLRVEPLDDGDRGSSSKS